MSASLAINFYLLKLAGGLQKQARVGLSRLDWVSCYQAAKSAAIEAQQWQRRLAVTTALLAVETDRGHYPLAATPGLVCSDAVRRE